MENLKEKNIIKKLILVYISEILCFLITRIYLTSYDKQNIYGFSMNIVQSLYFLPIFLISIYFLISKKPNKSLIIHSTIGLIFYSITLHIFIIPICSLFTKNTGIVHFVEYASKIYFICLPLIGFRIFFILREKNMKKLYLFIFMRIILLSGITILFHHLFQLKGILYGWTICEFIVFLISCISFLIK